MDDRITDGDVRRLRHALGADSRSPGYRNYYAANMTGPDEESWRRLERMGLAETYGKRDGLRYWKATDTGCRMCGINPERIPL